MKDESAEGWTTDQILAFCEPAVRARAWKISPRDFARVEDLAQEGLLAVWSGIKSVDPSRGLASNRAFLVKRAEWAMLRALERGRWTGMPPRHHGRHSDIHAAREDPYSGDDLAAFEEEGLGSDQGSSLLDSIMMTYHHEEIKLALELLPPKQRSYVYAKFWLDYNTQDMIKFFGYDPRNLWKEPIRGARARLREKLEHLAS